jgi:hypothetical protein
MYVFRDQLVQVPVENLIKLFGLQENHNTSDRITIREIMPCEKEVLLSWVRSRSAMKLVSSDKSDCLTIEILDTWLAHSKHNFLAFDTISHRPVGFCTLSAEEIPQIPNGYIELCHLVVDPRKMYFFVGALLCKEAKRVASKMGYKAICGRVVPSNRYGLALAGHESFIEYASDQIGFVKGFRWFVYPMFN